MPDIPIDRYAIENRAPAEKPDYGFVEMIDGTVRVHTPTGEDVLHRRWHANGVLESECHKVSYQPVGLYREWHNNGVLAKEVRYHDGLAHGVVRQFNRNGELLGKYEMTNGRGLKTEWNEDGSLRSCYHQISTNASWGATYDDLGKPHKAFLWNGKPMSRKKWYDRLDPVQRSEAEAAEATVLKDSKAPHGALSPEARAFRALRRLKRKTES